MDLLYKVKAKLYYTELTKKAVALDEKIGGKSLVDDIATQYGEQGAHDTQSTDYRILDNLFERFTLSDSDEFIDIGCGLGRVLSYLITEKNFKGKLVGVELSETVAAMARDRFKDYPQVEIIAGDAVENIPADGTVFYLFNPFENDVLKRFLDHFEQVVNHPAVIVYVFPAYGRTIAERDKFTLRERFVIDRPYIDREASAAIFDYNP